MWPKDEQEILRLLRENNAMLRQIIQALASVNGASSPVRDFFVDVLANCTADDLSKL
jgi:hypothetical protein